MRNPRAHGRRRSRSSSGCPARAQRRSAARRRRRKPRWLRSRSRCAATSSIWAWSSSLRAVDRASCASSAARLASASRPASVACSCASLLRSSGLSISASAWPCLTTSPATTCSVTVPPAIAYSVGLLEAITRPSAEMSRTRSPRVTVAMRTRLPSNERLPPLHPASSHATSSSPATPSAPPISQGRRKRDAREAVPATGMSWAEVSRMLMRAGVHRRMSIGIKAGCVPAPKGCCACARSPCPVSADTAGVRPDTSPITRGRYTGGSRTECDSCAASSARSRIAMWFPC